ncbi:MAG TPA: NUDIX hydrolase [Candidatus Saccharimonadales bacterium]|jgi:ADP-ribose pyrophosphatase YjhB (NUDIX family)|nr:NUDIX hydrolase [Candidatus Saccharimonadales bacterium]
MSTKDSHGIIVYSDDSARKTDYLYRISLKCLIRNEAGEVLVVKETGRTWWDLPGGGMDHSEDIKTAIAREMKEEVNLEGAFSYNIIAVDEPAHLSAHNLWQIRLIFAVKPQNMTFSAGEDGDEVAFINPRDFEKSELASEQRIYTYSTAHS